MHLQNLEIGGTHAPKDGWTDECVMGASRVRRRVAVLIIAYPIVASRNNAKFRLRRYLQNEKDRAIAVEATIQQTAAAKDREIEHLHAQARCSICMERRSDTTFICVRDDGMHFVCGHLACAQCADQWRNVKKECHVCRAQIYQCTKLYFSGES